MKFRLSHGRDEFAVSTRREKERSFVDIDGNEYEVTGIVFRGNTLTFQVGDDRPAVTFVLNDARCHIALAGEYYVIEAAGRAASVSKGLSAEQENSVASPMPGLVVKLFVKAGDHVKKGAAIAIVEAMKMQNELRSPLDGVVKDVNFREGDQVDALKPIVHIEVE